MPPPSRPTASQYGAVPLDIEASQPSTHGAWTRARDSHEPQDFRDRRWSVLEKLDRRHYCRIRSCSDCLAIINSRCLLATLMLGTFLLLLVIFARTVILSENILIGERYDFIVVGAGPSGSVITNKLVSHGANVLLLEAGEPTQHELGGKDFFAAPMSRFDIPLMWTSVSTSASYHWQGFNLAGLIVAKGLGGGGTNNAMLYVRSLPSDIQKWAIAGWGWEDVKEHYLSLEDFGGEVNESNADYHHVGGPIRTIRAPYVDEIAPEFISSAVHHGIPFTSDFNAPGGRVGVGFYDFNIRGGLRDSAARALLAPLLNSEPPNPKLTLQTGAEARKIILSGASGLSHKSSTASPEFAVGVEYEYRGEVKRAYISSGGAIGSASLKKYQGNRGVVLTCGAILTPKLLMSSGIGPREVLEAADIPVNVENPWVGKNLQDHPAVGVVLKLSPALSSSFPSVYSSISHWDDYASKVSRAASGENIPDEEFGVLSSPGISAGAFLVSPFSIDNVPDIQLTVFPSMSEPHMIRQKQQKGKQMLITVALMSPDARYELVLNNSCPSAVPRIQLPVGSSRYLGDLDVKRLAWGVKQVIAISKTQPLAALVEEVISPELSADGSYEDWVLENHYPNSHWSGSVRMSASSINGAVDENLNVRGVRGLFVGDASVIPFIPNGNIHSTVLAVAARAADLLLRDPED